MKAAPQVSPAKLLHEAQNAAGDHARHAADSGDNHRANEWVVIATDVALLLRRVTELMGR